MKNKEDTIIIQSHIPRCMYIFVYVHFLIYIHISLYIHASALSIYIYIFQLIKKERKEKRLIYNNNSHL